MRLEMNWRIFLRNELEDILKECTENKRMNAYLREIGI